MLVNSDRRYRFPVEPDALWEALLRVDDYRTWWPWLRRFEPAKLEPGARWHCSVQPPLPYAVHFTLVLIEVVDRRSIEAAVEGGLTGRARLDIAPCGPAPGSTTGSELRLTSALSPNDSLLKAVALVARPVATFGHDWILDTGFRQFSALALPVNEAAQGRVRPAGRRDRTAGWRSPGR